MLALASVDLHNALGLAGRQHCYISADLRRFRTLTLGKYIIFGRKTLLTFPQGKALPKRHNLLLSSSVEAAQLADIEVFASVPELLDHLAFLRQQGVAETDLVVIGGASVYTALWNYIDTLELTRIKQVFAADVFLPDPLASGFHCTQRSETLSEEGLEFFYERWQR